MDRFEKLASVLLVKGDYRGGSTTSTSSILKSVTTVLLLGLLATAGCRQLPSEPATADNHAACVADYNPATDYFPNKVQPKYATGFSVDYYNHYKVVTVTQPWQAANETFEYLLVQCGTPVPEGFEEAQVIQVPVNTVVTLSTTYLPHLELLNQLDGLVGMDDFSFVYTPSVRQKIEQGELIAFSSGKTLDLERLLVSEPELIMTYGIGDPDVDGYGRLIQAGLPVVLAGEYVENSPLGRAEWLLFTALFFNQEAKAQQVFTDISTEYESLVELTAGLLDRPTVFSGFSYEGTWYMPGGKSYAAQLLRDAGSAYLWEENESTVTIPLDFESVVDQAATADVWVNVSQDWFSYGDAIATDPRYGSFDAFKQGNVFNNNARINDTGGNDYWESGAVKPHLLLADLVKIFHPQLLPDHELVYYQKLEP
ncbi:ABC transporter substrate-binding protein [Leptolyngbyaceae cyanobacterium CCMR0082]|uniref:ABC transporter substrate-binding protein n=2 Tax=Adonisia turfae TaxID=2950184 RepID=A0A6M0RZ18_9CYAN|nr:ABC transporter substrate-binding protein [Adonisia turfae]NEZ57953.1 ABC transporter substrate-binding protein [Adonisia turfae CCMR0081]NEZ61455.1 ABC transporter substrate-binding protein [Adonisia turfae CCMR0082]